MLSQQWMHFAKVAIVIAIAMLLAWRWYRQRKTRNSDTTQPVYQGIQHLLNEEHDDALNVLVEAANLNPQTAEAHLALGTLYRKQGDIEKATRIHQLLTENAQLDKRVRATALFELAQDYFKAGLYDRAEDLFHECYKNEGFTRRSGLGLLQIYELEKEWASAILIAENLAQSADPEITRSISHYYCELAESALNSGRINIAQKHVKKALGQPVINARATILQGRCEAMLGNHQAAVEVWLSLQKTAPEYLGEVVDHLDYSYQAQGDEDGFIKTLSALQAQSDDARILVAWLEKLHANKSSQVVSDKIQQLLNEKPSLGLLRYVVTAKLQNKNRKESRNVELFKAMSWFLQQENDYVCGHCGFAAKHLQWRCPSCQRWGTIIHRTERLTTGL